MEKIAKALEKARRQRDAQSTATPAVAPAPLADGVGTAGAPRYQSTRVISSDRTTLKERRVVAGITPSSGHNPMELADAFRILRTRVYQQMSATGGTTLAVTSPNMSEGKTVVAANLAISLTQFSQHTVLLVDVDLRRPAMHKIFEIEPRPGLGDYLLKGTPLSDCLVSPDIDGLVVLPSGGSLARSSETLSSDRMTALAAEMKNRYPDRLVVYDLPPLLPTDDAIVFLGNADASLLVIEEGRTRRGDIERAIELLANHNMIGTVLNKATSTSGAYSYY
jgi:capsular exopolysaccharide synthesis family protein